MIAIIGTSDRPCWLAEACKILLLLLLIDFLTYSSSSTRGQSHVQECQVMSGVASSIIDTLSSQFWRLNA